MLQYYYAIDGDDIGKKLERFALLNDIDSIALLSKAVCSCLDQIRKYLESKGARIIFCAGDSVLASSNTKIDLKMSNLCYGEFSFSAGVGSSCSNATLALKKAKGLGKRRIEIIL